MGDQLRVKIEPAGDSKAVVSPEEQARLWQDWVENGPQGPVELEGEIDRL